MLCRMSPESEMPLLTCAAAPISPRVFAPIRVFRGQFLMPKAGYDFRTPQELLGHRDVNTSEIYTHVTAKPAAVADGDQETLMIVRSGGRVAQAIARAESKKVHTG